LERRLAAILAADVVGYSRLMGEDEAGTLARLTELRQRIWEPLIAACACLMLTGDWAAATERSFASWYPS
jgi:class 3 adenylate cyclase